MLPVRPGDRFLLCSDGLSDYVTDDVIARDARDRTPTRRSARPAGEAAAAGRRTGQRHGRRRRRRIGRLTLSCRGHLAARRGCISEGWQSSQFRSRPSSPVRAGAGPPRRRRGRRFHPRPVADPVRPGSPADLLPAPRRCASRYVVEESGGRWSVIAGGRRARARPGQRGLRCAQGDGHVLLGTLDWYEEDERVYAHARQPNHRVDTLRRSRRVQVYIGGQRVANSARPLILFETRLPTRYYLPFTDVRTEVKPPTRRPATARTRAGRVTGRTRRWRTWRGAIRTRSRKTRRSATCSASTTSGWTSCRRRAGGPAERPSPDRTTARGGYSPSDQMSTFWKCTA